MVVEGKCISITFKRTCKISTASFKLLVIMFVNEKLKFQFKANDYIIVLVYYLIYYHNMAR